jgi:hypothetical protein
MPNRFEVRVNMLERVQVPGSVWPVWTARIEDACPQCREEDHVVVIPAGRLGSYRTEQLACSTHGKASSTRLPITYTWTARDILAAMLVEDGWSAKDIEHVSKFAPAYA